MTTINVYKNNKTKKIVKGTVIAILMGILITFLITLLMGYKYKFVVTSSMEPTYRTRGCIIAVCPCDYDEVEIGDVVTWGAGKTTFTHRVIGKVVGVDTSANSYTWVDGKGVEHTDTDSTPKVGTWVQQGDNPDLKENDIKGFVNESSFVGRVVFHSNFVGYIVNYIQTNLFLVVFCLVVIFICCLVLI